MWWVYPSLTVLIVIRYLKYYLLNAGSPENINIDIKRRRQLMKSGEDASTGNPTNTIFK
jgi:hypothetical protein